MATSITDYRFSEYGNSNVPSLQQAELQEPAPGEIQIRHMAIGVNYIDINQRKGVSAAKLPLPSGLGMEGVGVVTFLGAEVSNLEIGDRVAYVGGPPGGYSSHRNLPAARALRVPEGLQTEDVSALIFKGLTVEYLIHRCVPVARGEVVLFHAAAGGVGSIACQWLKDLGATVIGTVSTDEKAEIAHRNGCDHVIIYTQDDFLEKVTRITGGRGVRVVYDSVGAVTFAKSLKCLRPRGTLVCFGETLGPVEPLNVASLGSMGSLFVTRPSIAHYTADRSEYEIAANRLFKAIADGIVKSTNVSRYAFGDAAHAHRDMESRKTKGSIMLIP